jgi:hypothetical protein
LLASHLAYLSLQIFDGIRQELDIVALLLKLAVLFLKLIVLIPLEGI